MKHYSKSKTQKHEKKSATSPRPHVSQKRLQIEEMTDQEANDVLASALPVLVSGVYHVPPEGIGQVSAYSAIPFIWLGAKNHPEMTDLVSGLSRQKSVSGRMDWQAIDLHTLHAHVLLQMTIEKPVQTTLTIDFLLPFKLPLLAYLLTTADRALFVTSSPPSWAEEGRLLAPPSDEEFAAFVKTAQSFLLEMDEPDLASLRRLVNIWLLANHEWLEEIME